MPADKIFPVRIPAYIDVYEDYLEFRAVDQVFSVSREVDETLNIMGHRISGRVQGMKEGLHVNAVEREGIRNFEDRHVAEHGINTEFTMHYQFSGVGTSTEIRCVVCQQAEDVTDSSHW